VVKSGTLKSAIERTYLIRIEHRFKQSLVCKMRLKRAVASHASSNQERSCGGRECQRVIFNATSTIARCIDLDGCRASQRLNKNRTDITRHCFVADIVAHW
jgi:hypothetical protein